MTIPFDFTALAATDIVDALSDEITPTQAGILAGDTNPMIVKKYILALLRRKVISKKTFKAAQAAAISAASAVTTDIPVQ